MVAKFRPRLDRRQDYVKRTITTIQNMGLECDRTPQTGEFRITLREPTGVIVRYARTPEEAIAVANIFVARKN